MSDLAFFGRGVLVTGVERQSNGGVRVYVGPRYEGRYFLAHPDDKDSFERQWAGSISSHLVLDRDFLAGLPILSEGAAR